MRSVRKGIICVAVIAACVLFCRTDCFAAERAGIGYIISYDSSGEAVGASGAFALSIDGETNVCMSGSGVLSSNAAYYTAVFEGGMEETECLAFDPDTGWAIFRLPAFVTEWEMMGSAEGLTTDTRLQQAVMDEDGEVGWCENYVQSVGSTHYQLYMPKQEGVFVGGPVVSQETERVVGVVVSTDNRFVTVDEIVNHILAESDNTSQGKWPQESNAPQEDAGDAYSGAGAVPVIAGSSGGGLPWGVVILVIVVVLVVLLFGNRKKNTNQNIAKSYAGIASVSDAQPVLVCVGGIHSGMEFPLEEELVFGRDAGRCNLVFPQQTKGISSVHAKVGRWDTQIEVMDLGSTYGTYLEDGTKLSPHIPYTLERGQGFYLADRQNLYRVR